MKYKIEKYRNNYFKWSLVTDKGDLIAESYKPYTRKYTAKVGFKRFENDFCDEVIEEFVE